VLILNIKVSASPQPSPKERELKTVDLTNLQIKVLSFGEDLGEAELFQQNTK